MKYQALSAAAAMAASAAAAPSLQLRQDTSAIPDDTPFKLLATVDGNGVGDLPVTANNAIYVGTTMQEANCTTADPGYATFFFKANTLNLKTPDSVQQTLYTDRSGMGQGLLSYSTSPDGYGPPRNSETEGWVVGADGQLSFGQSGWLACRNRPVDSFTLWVNAGVNNPAGYSTCTKTTVRAVVEPQPAVCIYKYEKRTN